MIDVPTISLHRGSTSVTLSNVDDDGSFLLTQGANGLGWGPHEIATAALAGGGSVVRHRRLAEAEVMLPILLGARDFYQRRMDRRTLEQLCDGEVEIRITHGDGWFRSRMGYLKDGLEGSYGSGEDSHDGQQIVLSFLCPDPWWYGSEKGFVQKVEAGRKPFITSFDGPATIPFFPVVLASSTVAGAYQLQIAGDAPAWPVWEIHGPGEDLLIESVDTGDRIFIEGEFGEVVTVDTRQGDIYSETYSQGELWDRVSLDSVLFPLKPGNNSVKVTMVNARPDSEVRLRYREVFRAGH